MWGQVADVINHANFYLHRSKGYAPRGGRNLPYSIDLINVNNCSLDTHHAAHRLNINVLLSNITFL